MKPLEKLQSFRQKQKSFRFGVLEKQQSFQEKKSRDSAGKRGDTQLHLAARTGNVVHIERILSQCDPYGLRELISAQNQDGETALYVAADNGHSGAVCELLKASDIQSASLKADNSYDSFHIAAKHGHLEVLKELLHCFPSLAMTTNSSNSTALNSAASQGHESVVNLLLETDASLAKITRSNGKTVLHSAARMGHLEVVKSILSKDPSIGLRTDKKGQAPIHMAVKGNNVEIVLELLKTEISVINMEDNKGNTPLHIATRKGRPEILSALLSVDGIDINVVNRAGETALNIAEKACNEATSSFLREAGALASKERANPPNTAKQLKQTVSDIRHEVQFQLVQTRQTEKRVQNIKKRLHKLHVSGLNNAINSSTVVAVLIATIAFAAIFTMPGQYIETPTDGYTIGEANIANKPAFIIFLVFDSSALFISLAVVVVQTSLIVIEQKAKKRMVFVINKLMWLACLFVSISFVSLTYVVVGKHSWWLAWFMLAIGASIMLTTIGSMFYCIVVHRIEERSRRDIRRQSLRRSRGWSISSASDSEILNSEKKFVWL
ncbi:ankyrin repeat-containing protein At5g02620-like [Asparagus officinalis]|uniref:ankyrin repeat-containing protein At5g02620-like n=1 Tax=Asparagus officinalis TaxID=4686 RepID=UPI00098E1989|nr:ankyrin repeat-containing protein At5g02620-like [Asparagus officinalis]XP_020246874.1 ankyrin repeat-containing protein At5g02620-like [Asparagus officinalis]